MNSNYDRKIEIGTAAFMTDTWRCWQFGLFQFAITSDNYLSTLEKASLTMTKRKTCHHNIKDYIL